MSETDESISINILGEDEADMIKVLKVEEKYDFSQDFPDLADSNKAGETSASPPVSNLDAKRIGVFYQQVEALVLSRKDLEKQEESIGFSMRLQYLTQKNTVSFLYDGVMQHYPNYEFIENGDPGIFNEVRKHMAVFSSINDGQSSPDSIKEYLGILEKLIEKRTLFDKNLHDEGWKKAYYRACEAYIREKGYIEVDSNITDQLDDGHRMRLEKDGNYLQSFRLMQDEIIYNNVFSEEEKESLLYKLEMDVVEWFIDKIVLLDDFIDISMVKFDINTMLQVSDVVVQYLSEQLEIKAVSFLKSRIVSTDVSANQLKNLISNLYIERIIGDSSRYMLLKLLSGENEGEIVLIDHDLKKLKQVEQYDVEYLKAKEFALTTRAKLEKTGAVILDFNGTTLKRRYVYSNYIQISLDLITLKKTVDKHVRVISSGDPDATKGGNDAYFILEAMRKELLQMQLDFRSEPGLEDSYREACGVVIDYGYDEIDKNDPSIEEDARRWRLVDLQTQAVEIKTEYMTDVNSARSGRGDRRSAESNKRAKFDRLILVTEKWLEVNEEYVRNDMEMILNQIKGIYQNEFVIEEYREYLRGLFKKERSLLNKIFREYYGSPS